MNETLQNSECMKSKTECGTFLLTMTKNEKKGLKFTFPLFLKTVVLLSNLTEYFGNESILHKRMSRSYQLHHV